MDKFRRMKIFVAVVEAGQVTRAAQMLHLSKSAVSHALTDLEKYLDLQLLNRNNRSWQLTDAGSTFYEQCKKILTDVEMMEDRVRADSQRLSGLIRVSATDTFGCYILSPVISKFMNLHPKIVIDFTLTDRFVDLIEERVDIAFRTGPVKDNSLVGHKIGATKMKIYASPDYLDRHGTPETHLDIKNHKCLKYTRSPKWRLIRGGRRIEFVPKAHLLTDSGESLREFCIRGQGLAFLPTMLAEFAVKKGRLVGVLNDYDPVKMPIHALRVGDNHAPTRVIKLLDFVAQELNTRPRDVGEYIQV